jgi:hypothetical protein
MKRLRLFLSQISLTVVIVAFGGIMAFFTGYLVAISRDGDVTPVELESTPWIGDLLPDTPESRGKTDPLQVDYRTQVGDIQEPGWSCNDARRPVYVRPRAAEAELRGQNWRCATLRRGNLAGVMLVDVAMQGAIMRRLNLAGAQLDRVAADGAVMQKAVLTHARIQNSSFAGTMLRRSNWIGAVLENVSLIGADLRGADFCGVQGLHPSMLDGARMAGMRCPNGFMIPRMAFGGTVHECPLFEPPLPVAECRLLHERDNE